MLHQVHAMSKQRVSGYKRKPYRLKGKLVKPRKTRSYSRRKRPKAKKRFIGKKAYYPVYDEYGQRRGWSRKPGR